MSGSYVTLRAARKISHYALLAARRDNSMIIRSALPHAVLERRERGYRKQRLCFATFSRIVLLRPFLRESEVKQIGDLQGVRG